MFFKRKPDTELISIHIPKTGGTSFLNILCQVYRPETVFHFHKSNFADKSLPEVEQFKARLKADWRIIHSHYHYKEISDLIRYDRTKVIAWLRDPVERVISDYSHFIKRRMNLPEDEDIGLRRNEPILKFARLPECRNRMSKFLSGRPIDQYFFLGISEFYDEDIRILAKLLGWKMVLIPRLNDN